MGKPPAVIIIARHGARLDQADKEWHLNNPLAYDPPLSYGGWTQARALGVRIGNILKTVNAEAGDDSQATPNANGNGNGASRKRKRKQNIIIHSSPFTRCVQTSIAIGAGIGQTRTRFPSFSKPPAMHSGSPHLHTQHNSPALPAIPEPWAAPSLPPLSSDASYASLQKSTMADDVRSSKSMGRQKDPVAELRLDGFLGEWLSPDYFEKISPPPGSATMVQNAKIQLLQPAEPIGGGTATKYGHFPGGWSLDFSTPSSADESEEKGGVANMAVLDSSLPYRNRSRTHGGESPSSYGVSPSDKGANIKLNTTDVPRDASYVPPTPSYAVSASEPIPVGFVAHARDACVSFPLTWDSEQPPQLWGDGGEYGEEWGRMHRRFRNGLVKMVQWYEEQGSSTSQGNGDLRNRDDDDDDDIDTVLILVTHGAGCNALIGALTNQPVLLDVGMASLTLAVRKETTPNPPSHSQDQTATTTNAQPPSPSTRRNGKKSSILDTGLASSYEMRFTASVEHLRGNVNTAPLASPRIGPAIGFAFSPKAYHYSSHNTRCANTNTNTISSSSDTPLNFSIGEAASPSASAFGSLPSRPMTSAGAPGSPPSYSYNHFPTGTMGGSGTMHRSTSTHSPLRGLHHRPVSSTPMISSGLWRSGTGTSVGSGNDGESGTESDTLPNFGALGSKKSPTVGAGAGGKKKTIAFAGGVKGPTETENSDETATTSMSQTGSETRDPAHLPSAAEMDAQTPGLDTALAGNSLIGSSANHTIANITPNTTAVLPVPNSSSPISPPSNLPQQIPAQSSQKPIRTLSQKGLWGSAASLAFTQSEKERDGVSAAGGTWQNGSTANGTPKRRWTSVEGRAG